MTATASSVSSSLTTSAICFGGRAAADVAGAVFAPALTGWLSERMAAGLRFDATLVGEPERMLERLLALVLPVAVVILPLLAGVVLLAAASGILAGGWNFSLKAMEPKLEKFEPIATA